MKKELKVYGVEELKELAAKMESLRDVRRGYDAYDVAAEVRKSVGIVRERHRHYNNAARNMWRAIRKAGKEITWLNVIAEYAFVGVQDAIIWNCELIDDLVAEYLSYAYESDEKWLDELNKLRDEREELFKLRDEIEKLIGYPEVVSALLCYDKLWK